MSNPFVKRAPVNTGKSVSHDQNKHDAVVEWLTRFICTIGLKGGYLLAKTLWAELKTIEQKTLQMICFKSTMNWERAENDFS